MPWKKYAWKTCFRCGVLTQKLRQHLDRECTGKEKAQKRSVKKS